MRGRRAVSDQIPGNGIGLNLVKRIIIMHGGIISLESKQDAGSTFTITLPESKGDADAE
jgi:signal transduction histidine kinase